MAIKGFFRRLPDTPPLTRLAEDVRTLVLHFRHHPTVHYYWRSRYADATIIDTSTMRPDFIDLSEFGQIVIVRHIAPDWLSLLVEAKPAHTPVIYFLDDDIPGLVPDGFLPGRYVVRNRYRFLRSLRALDRVCDSVCVSTAALAERYALPSQSVVEPLPCKDDLPPTDERQRDTESTPVVFYHGTGSHLREIVWLQPVIEGVSKQIPDVIFEFFGGDRVERIFTDVANVQVLRQMSWKDYLCHCRSRPFDVGLAPLLPTRFNHVRSHVKFFDITRCGAAGIYSNRPPFDGIVESGLNGLLVDDSKDAWIEAIVTLATNEAMRERLFQRALHDVQRRVRLRH
jgi:hypothetical protein